MNTLAKYMADLNPRACVKCSAPTGSVALDQCADCETESVELPATSRVHRRMQSPTTPTTCDDIALFRETANLRDAGAIDNAQYDEAIEPIMERAHAGGYMLALMASVSNPMERRSVRA